MEAFFTYVVKKQPFVSKKPEIKFNVSKKSDLDERQ